MRLRIVATGPVYVCLKAGDRTLVNGQTLQAGQRTPTFRSRRFRLTLGNNAVRLRINGQHAQRARRRREPIGLQITPRRRPPAAVGGQAPRLQSVSVRAGIVVTGTEVLTGRVLDRNGPWLSERLLELGADPTAIVVVGDRPEDILRALRFLAARGLRADRARAAASGRPPTT